MRLDKFQRNEVFLAISAAGLSPSDFELLIEPSQITRLRHRASGASFAIGEQTSIGGTRVYETVADRPERARLAPSWMGALRDWLALVKRDLETPDLWAALGQQQTMLDGAPPGTGENTPFSDEEQQQIVAQLAEVRAFVRQTYELSSEQTRLLEGQLNYLQEAASRMGRIDWRNALTGVLLGAAVNAMLPGEAVRDALYMLFRSIGHMFGHPMPELPAGM